MKVTCKTSIGIFIWEVCQGEDAEQVKELINSKQFAEADKTLAELMSYGLAEIVERIPLDLDWLEEPETFEGFLRQMTDLFERLEIENMTYEDEE